MKLRFCCAALALVLVGSMQACESGPPNAGVMVVMRTDMVVPRYVHAVGLYISHLDSDGRSTTVVATKVPTAERGDGKRTVSLPSDFAVQSNGDEGARVQVRVVAYDEFDVPVTMRESRTRVPTKGLQSLSMPLLWMNQEQLEGDPNDVFTLTSKVCGADQTLGDDGECTSVEQVVLEPYEQLVVEPSTESGACTEKCFDVSSCFKPEFAEDADDNYRAARGEIDWFDEAKTRCGVSLGFRGGMVRTEERKRELSQGLAVAVRVAPDQGGYCTKQDPSECYIVIDAKTSVTLANKNTPAGDRLWALLPKGICRSWERGAIYRNTAVAVPGCVRKAANMPMCRSDQTGCASDVGWDGTTNPRKAADGTTPEGSDARVCRVPGASALVATARGLLVMTQSGQPVLTPFDLSACAPATEPALPGEPSAYHFVGQSAGVVAFSRGNAEVGVLSPKGDGFVASLTALPRAGAHGIGISEKYTAYVAPDFARLQPPNGEPTDIVLDAFAPERPFNRVSNGLRTKEGFQFFATGEDATGKFFTVLNGPLDSSSMATGYGERLAFSGDYGEVLDAASRTFSFVLTRTGEGMARMFAYAAGREPLDLSLLLPEDTKNIPVERDATLSDSTRALFLGSSDGRIYRIEPTATLGRGQSTAQVLWTGSAPIHGMHYVPSEVSDRRVAGRLYFVTWPDNDPALARVQFLAVDAAGNATPPDEDSDAGSSTSSSGNASSSSSGSNTSASSSGGSSSSSTGGSSTSSGAVSTDGGTVNEQVDAIP